MEIWWEGLGGWLPMCVLVGKKGGFLVIFGPF
jgi:hypothetical protein